MNLEEIALNGTKSGGLRPGGVSDFSMFELSPYAASASPAGIPGLLTTKQVPFEGNDEPLEQVWPKRYECNFIEPGLVLYRGEGGKQDDMVLIEGDVLDRIAKSLINKPVIDWDHADVWPSMIAEGKSDGIVSDVFKGEDGWWHCKFNVWTASAIKHCDSGEWFVSCAYVPTRVDKTPGKHHNVPYTEKVLDGEYTHLALVKNPRYENARIRANSKEGGYKMAFSWLSKKPSALRLNSGEGEDKVLVNVDGKDVDAKELFDALEAEERDSKVLNGADEDEIELDGKKAKLGDLRQAHRNRMNKLKNSSEPVKGLVQPGGKSAAGHVEGGEVGGVGAAEIGNLDKGVESGQDSSKKAEAEMKERLQELEKKNALLVRELSEVGKSRSNELRNAAEFRALPVAGVPEDKGFVSKQERLKMGRERMNSASVNSGGEKR